MTVTTRPPIGPGPRPGTVRLLMRLRPTQLADLVKRLLGIQRLEWTASTGSRYWVDPVSDFGASLMEAGVYEPVTTRLLQTLLRKGDTFVDLGANEGYFSILAGHLVGTGRVYAVEPQTRLQEVLRRNVSLNDLGNVHVEAVAIAESAGSMELFLRPTTNSGASSFYRHWRLGRRGESVPTMTLDQLFGARRVGHTRLLKVDCEGAELLVFRAAEEVLGERRIDYIALEFHPAIIGDANCREIGSTLRRHGYRLFTVEDQTVYHSPDVPPPPGGIPAH